MGHRHSAPRLIDGGATDLPVPVQSQPRPTPPRSNRRNKLQKPPGPGGRSVFSDAYRRLSVLDAHSSKHPNSSNSLASLDSANLVNGVLSTNTPHMSNPPCQGSDVSGQISRKPTLKSTCGPSEDGLDELPSSAPAEDIVSLLRRKSMLFAAPPATVTRKPGTTRARRNTMPAKPLDQVLEMDTQRCMTPSAISVIGAFKRGSLRITNGCASPAPSSVPASPPNIPIVRRHSIDSVLDLAPRKSWESTRTTTIQVIVEDADMGEIGSKENVQEHISTTDRDLSSSLILGAPETSTNRHLHRRSPVDGFSRSIAPTVAKYTKPHLTIRHVCEDGIAVGGGAPNPNCTVQYYESPPRPRFISTQRVSLRGPHSQVQKASPAVNSPAGDSETDNIEPLKPLKEALSTVDYTKVQDLPLDSKITGQEYYQRFSRRRSQLAMAR